MSIQFYPSPIFDAVCTCNHLTGRIPSYHHALQNTIVTELKETADGRFTDGAISYSNLCAILYLCADVGSMTLCDLSAFFANIADYEPILRQRVQNGFRASFLFPTMDLLKEKMGAVYSRYVNVLIDMDFETIWREKILPVEEEQIKKLTQTANRFDTEKMLSLISKLKELAITGDVEIFVSLMSYPVSFMLSDTAFLDTINDPAHFPSMVAHELMHGFSSTELTALYRKTVKKSRYLRACHKTLIEDMHSGDEEEFVMAAEYFITWKAGICTREEIVLQNYGRYGGCVPLALCIFDLLCKETDVPSYNDYLIGLLRSKKLDTDFVIDRIDRMMPQPTDEENFFANLFVRLQRCALLVRDAQLADDEGLCEKIETLTGARFAPNSNPRIAFANGEKEMPEQAHRSTLSAPHLVVDAIVCASKTDTLKLHFPYSGSNIGAYSLKWEGESIKTPYIFNLRSGDNLPIRAEFSFVSGNTRFLITSTVEENSLTDWSTETIAQSAEMIFQAVQNAERIVLLLNTQ